MGIGQPGDAIEENLEDQVRRKVEELTQEYLDEGYDEEQATAMAQIEAREWAEGKR